ncbi:hypothetical protein MRX96_036031 [Rhipicephalus microplus]
MYHGSSQVDGVDMVTSTSASCFVGVVETLQRCSWRRAVQQQDGRVCTVGLLQIRLRCGSPGHETERRCETCLPLSAVLRWRQRQGRLEHYACAAENPLGAGSSRPVGLILLEKQALLLLLALLLFLVAFFCILAWNRRRLWLRGLRGRAREPQRGEVLRAASYSGASASCEHAEAHKPA